MFLNFPNKNHGTPNKKHGKPNKKKKPNQGNLKLFLFPWFLFSVPCFFLAKPFSLFSFVTILRNAFVLNADFLGDDGILKTFSSQVLRIKKRGTCLNALKRAQTLQILWVWGFEKWVWKMFEYIGNHYQLVVLKFIHNCFGGRWQVCSFTPLIVY